MFLFCMKALREESVRFDTTRRRNLLARVEKLIGSALAMFASRAFFGDGSSIRQLVTFFTFIPLYCSPASFALVHPLGLRPLVVSRPATRIIP